MPSPLLNQPGRPAPPLARQTEAEQASRNTASAMDQAGRLREEVGSLRRQFLDAKRSYDHEVMQHGDALKRYAGAPRAGTALRCTGAWGRLLVHAGVARAGAHTSGCCCCYWPDRPRPRLPLHAAVALETAHMGLQNRLNETVAELDAARHARNHVSLRLLLRQLVLT